MSGIALHITVEPEGGRPVSLARVCDGEVLRQAARAAVNKARASAEQAMGVNWFLGQIRNEEATSLERYLSLLIPGFAVNGVTPEAETNGRKRIQ